MPEAKGIATSLKMSSVQRAFAQKLSKQHAADVRKHMSSTTYPVQKDLSKSGSSVSVSMCDIVDPVDYEEFLLQHQLLVERDPLSQVLDFPENDVSVATIPRRIRTLEPVVPKEPFNKLTPHVQDCIRCYICDWLVVDYQYRRHSSSSWLQDLSDLRQSSVSAIPRQEYAMDHESACDTQSGHDGDLDNQSVGARSSWASLNLRNSESDQLIPGLLERVPPETIDQRNEARRMEGVHPPLFLLYPSQDVSELVERRTPAEMPGPPAPHRILVKCTQLKLSLEVEPMFASMALYDVRERKKLSENFYWDMNEEGMKKMLGAHAPHADMSTTSRSCILDISHPSPDLFLVIRLEKVLQGDLADVCEPYLKDDKNVDRVKASAADACDRLGKYRMPFAWTAVHLASVLGGNSGSNSGSLDRDASLEKDFSPSHSLERKSSLSRRGSLERRTSSERTSPAIVDLSSFRPLTVTVQSFFKQESDRLRDEDLYKLLLELKRQASLLKKLKCIPGTLKLDICPCLDQPKFSLTPELEKIAPYPSPEGKVRPCKEMMEFPCQEIYGPHYAYRNLLFVYPKEVNFSSRAGSARNIAVKVQIMCGEEPTDAMPLIFGKSSCLELNTEAYTSVIYHNKCPNFHDEIKMKLPANLGEEHHLLFTFYHVSCQRKAEQATVESAVGYTWAPLFSAGRLLCGELFLPVMAEPPPANYSYISPQVCLPGTKWVDNHRAIFTLSLEPVSSVHTQDIHLDKLLGLTTMLEAGTIPVRIGEANLEKELRVSLSELGQARAENVAKFLPLVTNKLLALMVGPTVVGGQPVNLASDAFHSLCLLAKNVSALPGRTGDRHERHSLLASLVAFYRLPTRPAAIPTTMPPMPARLAKSSSNPDVNADLEVDVITRGLDRACSMRQQGGGGGLPLGPGSPGAAKCLHEELALQWVVSTGPARELALTHSWFLLELLAKSMVQEACLDLPRDQRFSQHFTDDVATLASVLTSEITARHSKDATLSQRMNSSLAFFLFDLFSTMDRGFVFHLIKSYCKQMAVATYTATDPTILMGLKVDLLRIVCSHEHFVALNLPFGTPVMKGSAPSSPTPSVCSSTSQSSLASTIVPPDRSSFYELTSAFQRHHFLAGLVLSQLSSALQTQCNQAGYGVVQGRVVNLVRNLMTCHDFDPRYTLPECKARVAALYLPLLGIVMDNLSQLCLPLEGLSALGDDGEPGSGINAVVAMAISGSSIFNKSQGGSDPAGTHMAQGGGRLSAETRRHLLACFVWVLKNVSKPVLTSCWKELPLLRFHRLLETLGLCITCLEFRAASAHRTENTAGSLQAKARLEDIILGQGSARSEMMQRRKNAVASTSALDKPRWRKEQTGYRSSSALLDANPGLHSERLERAELGSRLEGNLAAEVSFTILDTLEDIVRVLSQSDHLQGLLGVVLKLLLAALSRRQSSSVLASMFATQRALVFKFPNLLFDEETEQCADLCLQLLKHCSGNLAQVRSQASASLYLLMRQNFEIGNNFARVKMQVTMSLSSLVGTSATFNEQSLRRSLKTILVYAEQDRELQDTSFPEQVKELLFNLHMILSDTVKMKEFKEDPEMLLDLMYRIAKGYQNSPDLRITWLENMAQKHRERKNHTEAGMCLVHCAALVAEYLRMLEPSPAFPAGAAHFERVSPNALDESAVSDDVLRPEDDGLCLGKDFTEGGLVTLLEMAAQSLYLAGMYEATNDVYHILIPIAEANRDYKKLTYIHGKLHEAFLRVEQLQGKRVFGTYFRVGFYGAKFGDLNGEEYIYKEPTLTKLPEIFSRLENFYVERFGPDNIVVIKDSNTVDLSELNPEKAYLQITYVEPYFEPFEARHRATHFDRNFNMKRFVYATPFTPSGRAHGELHEQHKRKTILTTAKHFPYVKTRIQVVHRKQLELSPIQVAIEDIQKKTQELAAATRQEPADPKILQMVLQGCIGTTVNQGPMEIATVFLTELKDRQKTPTKLQNKLRLCFKDFSKKCLDALKKNKNLIGLDQKDYQRELERNYHRFQERLAPLIMQPPRR